jgi:hypothetical protein
MRSPLTLGTLDGRCRSLLDQSEGGVPLRLQLGTLGELLRCISEVLQQINWSNAVGADRAHTPREIGKGGQGARTMLRGHRQKRSACLVKHGHPPAPLDHGKAGLVEPLHG